MSGGLKLDENVGRVFQGTILLGEGFKIDEATAREWIAADKRNQQILFPFLGGNEINKSAKAKPQCWVINFWDWPEDKAALFPVPYELVKSKVKPVRDKNKRKSRRNKWWIYGETATGLYCAIGQGHNFSSNNATRRGRRPSLNRVIAISTGVTKYPAFTFLPSTYVYSNKLCVLADDRFSTFAILTSDIHGVWAWAQKTSLGGDLYSLVYAHGNIFETFPFPVGFLERGDGELEELGKRFFQARQSFMETYNKGLTQFYNEFHDAGKTDSKRAEIRRIQEELNRLVCRRYGWKDLELACGFHKVGYLPDGKNIRFTIKEEVRLEVFRRLSKLNKTRFEEQSQSSFCTRPGIANEELIADAVFEDGLFARR